MSLIFTKKTIFTIPLEYEGTVTSIPFSNRIKETLAPYVTNNQTDGQVEILIGMNEAKFIRGWIDITSAESWVTDASLVSDEFNVVDSYEVVDYTTPVTVA